MEASSHSATSRMKPGNAGAREPWAGESDPKPWTGVSALMTLKGDVDNLGAIFERGLEAPSLSRMAALSRQMNAFFAVHSAVFMHALSTRTPTPSSRAVMISS